MMAFIDQNERRPLELAVLTVALEAKSGRIDEQQVEEMVQLAQQLLPSDNDLHQAVTGFATQVALPDKTPDDIRMQGGILFYKLEEAIGNVPMLARRADIDG